jgi:hypothetical protein
MSPKFRAFAKSRSAELPQILRVFRGPIRQIFSVPAASKVDARNYAES